MFSKYCIQKRARVSSCFFFQNIDEATYHMLLITFSYINSIAFHAVTFDLIQLRQTLK